MPTPTAGYRLKNGQRVPGTTTIIGRFKESGGLIQWAFQQGQKGVPLYETRVAAADIGTFVHACIEADLRGQPEPAAPSGLSEAQINIGRGAVKEYLIWKDGTKLDISPVEQPLVSEAFRFGGTPDAIGCEADDTLSMVDWKSSKAYYPDNLIQLAAYLHLWNETQEAQINGRIHVLRFGKEGYEFEHRSFSLDSPKLAAAWELFKLYRSAYDLDKVVTGKA